MGPNLKPSQRVAVVDSIPPQSTSTTVTSGWIDASKFGNFMALVENGALGASATVDAKLQQATDSSGTGAKDITGKAITQFTKSNSDDNKQAVINVQQTDLDIANSFNYFRLSITVGTAASQVAGLVLGFDGRYGPASSFANATQAQTIG